MTDTAAYTPRLRTQYDTTIRPALLDSLGIPNLFAAPRLTKIVLNMGVGDAAQDRKFIDAAARDLTAISGQKPVITRARKSIAGFKLRENAPIGVKVTLRRDRMYEFLDRLVTVALPRVRDFQGLSPSGFDGHGNYSFGIREQVVFAEIDFDAIDKIRGLQVVLCTSAATDSAAKALLAAFNMPFAKQAGRKAI